ncbi:MAG: FecR family protein [Sphingobacterium hotanense]
MEHPILKTIIKTLTGKATRKDQDNIDLYLASAFERDEWKGSSDEADKIKSRIIENVSTHTNLYLRSKNKIRSIVFKAAAAVLVFGFLTYQIGNIDGVNNYIKKKALAFSSNQYGLTTSDGDYLNLGAMKIGQIYEKPNFTLKKLSDNKLHFSTKHKTGRNTFVRLATNSNQSYHIELPDKSLIALDSKSELIFPSQFPEDSRQLEASGRIFCNVFKDATRPFSIKSENLTAVVRGTSFVFNDDSKKENSFIALIEGSLEMNTKESRVLLQPGQRGRFKESEFMIDNFNEDEIVAFTRNEFFFQNRTVKEIITQIAEWYNTEAEIADAEIENYKLTIKISRSKPLKQVLEILELTGALDIDIKERRIIIRKTT